MDDDKAKQLHEMEQSCASMAENYPPMWRRMFLNLLKEGFDEQQALRILLGCIYGMFGGKVVN